MKIFYLGMQRCGTKSFGEFFKRNNFKAWSWQDTVKHDLGRMVSECRYAEILELPAFKNRNVFEDAPFYTPEFARYIANYVEDSKFVFFERPAESWYESMVKHSVGMTLGNVDRHCYFYDRLEELNWLRKHSSIPIDKLSLIGAKEHYIKQYELHRNQILHLFSGFPSDRFFAGHLYDKEKYVKLNEAFGLNLQNLEESHVHESKLTVPQVLAKHRSLFKGAKK